MHARKNQKIRHGKLIAAVAAASGLHLASTTATATSYAASWIAPGGGAWTSSSAWSVAPSFPDNGQPNLGDRYSVYIGPVQPGSVINGFSKFLTLDQLTVNSPGSTVEVGSLSLLNGGSISGGTFEYGGGTLTLEADLNVSSTFNWLSGPIAGPGALNILPGATLYTTSDALSNNLNNSGTINAENQGFDLNTGVINNLPGGVMNFTSSGVLVQAFGTGANNVIYNAGLINLPTTGSSAFNAAVIDSGTINIPTGSTYLCEGITGTLSGNTYTYSGGAVVTGGGTVLLGNNNVTHLVTGAATFSAAHFSVDGCIITGPGTINLTSSMNWNGGTISGALNVAPGAVLTLGSSTLARAVNGTINNSSTMNFNGAGISGTGALNNLPGGTILLGNNASFTGTLSFSNSGTLILQNPDANLPVKTFNSGTYVINQGDSLFCPAGTFSYGGGAAITGAGSFNFANTQTLFGPLSVSVANAIMPGAGTITGSGDLNIQPGCSFSFASGDVLSGTGAVNIAANGVATFNTGTYSRNINNSGSIFFNAGQPTFSSARLTNLPGGVVNFNTAAQPYFVLFPFTNGGSIPVANGTLVMDDGMIYNTGANFSGAGTVMLGLGTLNGSLNLNNANTVFNDGNFALLTGPGDLDVNATMIWDAGSISGSGAINVSPNATLNVASISSATLFLGRTLNNSGTVNFAGQLGGGTINNQSGGFINITTNLAFSGSAGNVLALTNNGTVAFNIPAASTFSLSSAVTNSGTFIVNAGTLSLNSNFTHDNSYLTGTGTINIAGFLAGNMTLAGSNQYLNSSTTISGLGDIIVDGMLKWGAGTITGGGGALRVAQGGTLNLVTQGTPRFLGRELFNNGVVNATSTTLSFSTDSSIVNGPTGVFNVTGGFPFNAPLSNAGTLQINSGSSSTAAGFGRFNNTGTLIVGNGTSVGSFSVPTTLSVNQVDTVNKILTGGTWIVNANSQLSFADQFLGSQARITLNGSAATFTNLSTFIESSGTLSILNGATLSTTGSFTNDGITEVGSQSLLRSTGTLANTGTLVIDGLAISDYSSASPQAALAPQLATGFANRTWTGPGINSDLAAQIAADSTNIHKTAIGYAEASDLGIVGTGTFDGQPVDNTTFILRYVFFGDANLDGTVDSSDFSILAANYGKTGQNWDDGDYNYDGIVNALDFNALATNYGQLLSADIPDSALPFGGELVPEPMTGMIPILLALNIRRRRNRNRL